MSVLTLLRTAGGLPLSQLDMRSSASSDDTLEQLQALVHDGLVTVEGNAVPETVDQLKAGTAVAKLTRAGIRRTFS